MSGGPAEVRPDWPLAEEVRALARGRLCRGEERRRCRAEQGAFADWACGECREYLRPEDISPWTWHLLFLHQLQEAGYPFRANDLTLDTWLLLGLVKRLLAVERGGNFAQRRFHEGR